MTQEDNRSLSQKWMEFWGRKKILKRPPFTDTSILTQPIIINVGFMGYFLQLPENTAAIITHPTGKRQVFTEGGYQTLQEGAYTLHYVDLSERSISLPEITAPTLDGSELSLTVSINYKLEHPSEIIKIDKPLQALFSICEAAIKTFIITYRYDELIGEPINKQMISNRDIIQHVKEQVANSQSCRGFWLMDVIVEEKHGNSEINKLRHERNVQNNQSIAEQEYLVQQQKIAEERKKLELEKAEQEQLILNMRAENEATRNKILENASLFRVELEHLRKLPEMQHEQTLKKIDAIEKALQALIQAQATMGLPRDFNQGRLIDNFSELLTEIQDFTPSLPGRGPKSVNELGTTIINLIAPKK